jgi:hypothetical protein
MKNYTPTIHELQGKPIRELQAIFRKAAEVASNADAQPAKRAAAKKTMETVRRCLMRSPGQ